mmetsp:Transcript_57666/g.122684  ORF Transcript_57666/g.122684 Transcript_57666/m.122684 type:complete len:468 (+) Transcript_57666:296-1699(+)
MAVPRGSFRQRSRARETATQQLNQSRSNQVASQTLRALDKFEERLDHMRQQQLQEYEGLEEATARSLSPLRNSTKLDAKTTGRLGLSHGHNSIALQQSSHSAGDLRVPSRQQAIAFRPPSPLSFYDYGCISLKARSVFAQHQKQRDADPRPEHRRSRPGFYVPGSRYGHGTYGFSLVDPVLLPPRNWTGPSNISDRSRGDAADLRPLAAYALSTKRDRATNPSVPTMVRSNIAHDRRAQMAFKHLDKRREEAVVEQARFENGMFEGKWRDPMLDLPPGVLPEASPSENHAWLELPLAKMDSDQVMALRLLYNINSAMRHSITRFSDLFAKENSGPKGVLELEEFLSGLLRLGVYAHDEVTMPRLRRVVSVIDTGFDGRVNLPAIQRAVVAVRNLQEEPPPMGANLSDMERWGEKRFAPPPEKGGDYGGVAPVDAIRLNYNHGIFKFQHTFDKFKAQQKELLSHHNEQ